MLDAGLQQDSLGSIGVTVTLMTFDALVLFKVYRLIVCPQHFIESHFELRFVDW